MALWKNQMVYAGDVVSGKSRVNREELICPTCRQPVMIKSGQLKSAHFAHQQQVKCTTVHDGETLEHNQLKKLLFEWSNKKFEVECYLPELKQRPDLLWRRLAIEIQCSDLKQARMIERTNNYLRHHYQVWWLLGEKLCPKTKLTNLQRSFCTYHEGLGCCLWGLDVKKQAITLYYQVIEFPNGRLSFQKKSWLFGQQSLTEIYGLTCRFPIKQTTRAETTYFWGNYLRRIQQELMRSQKGVVDVQKVLYRKKRNLQTLPQWMYRPSGYYLFFRTHLLMKRLSFEEILNGRSCLTKEEANELFSSWYKINKSYWHFPLIPQKKILKFVFLECVQLKQIKIIKNQEK
ncbi:competence protein CoiA [Enterococcus sp. AZ194]|uniref:competence protein CoiA n=1 Tax=Enterococcus sp. AZ194 TaxID=2774629 RepID=UPI003F688153